MKPLNISIPDELREHAALTSADNHESIAAYVRRLILEDKRRRQEVKRNESAA